MSYLTDYTIEVFPSTALSDVLDLLTEQAKMYRFHLDGQIQDDRWESEDEWTWYENKEDCRVVSSLLPEVLIVVSGAGEDSGDIWRNIYRGGELVDAWRLNPNPPPIPKRLLPKAEAGV